MALEPKVARRVRLTTRRGEVLRVKPQAGPPAVNLELGTGQRLVSFTMEKSLMTKFGMLGDRVTEDWEWTAVIEEVLPPRRRRPAKKGMGKS